MSLLTYDDSRITVKPFASVPALLHLPAIERDPASVSQASSRHLSQSEAIREGVDLAEGCLLTKTVRYNNQVAHFVNAVWGGDPSLVEEIITEMRVIPFSNFTLDHPCNLAILAPSVHSALDLYAFIALAPSSSTLDGLIAMVKSDNNQRQQVVDETGDIPYRSLDFNDPNFKDPVYELIAIHPEHFLPDAVLSIYDRTTKTVKNYVASHDRRLRESVDPTSAPLPGFRHIFQQRPTDFKKVNIFLVALNAEIKFRRYFEMIEHHPPQKPLPTDVISLMRRVIELVELLYWRPSRKVGSQGALVSVAQKSAARRNPERVGRSSLQDYIDKSPGEEDEMDIEAQTTPSKARRRRPWLPDADLQTRKRIGSALMTGHDLDYDPALFENAFPLSEVPPLYSNSLDVEKWNRGVEVSH